MYDIENTIRSVPKTDLSYHRHHRVTSQKDKEIISMRTEKSS